MKKLYLSDKFFAAVTWLAVIGTIPYIVVQTILYSSERLTLVASAEHLLLSVFLAVVYIAYKKHSKNVMKGMMGAALTCSLVIPFAYSLMYEDFALILISSLALPVILFVNHFIINSDRHSSPAAVKFNQIASLVFAAMTLIIAIVSIFFYDNTAEAVTAVIYAVCQPCFALSIVCIESRLDAYRIDREKAGWTEENGYPEGYVHEYQKK